MSGDNAIAMERKSRTKKKNTIFKSAQKGRRKRLTLPNHHWEVLRVSRHCLGLSEYCRLDKRGKEFTGTEADMKKGKMKESTVGWTTRLSGLRKVRSSIASKI